LLGNETSNEGNAGADIPEEAEAKNAREMLEYLDEQVNHGKSMGVIFSDIEGTLSAARMMLDSGEYEDAVELINQCMQMASQRFSEHQILTVTIRKAEKEIQAAHNLGKDVSEAGKLLKMARLHMEKGDYRLAIESAKHAQSTLTNKKSNEVVWGSGLEFPNDSE
jgi:outer membrane PBP1 activator LpoA protein